MTPPHSAMCSIAWSCAIAKKDIFSTTAMENVLGGKIARKLLTENLCVNNPEKNTTINANNEIYNNSH